MHIYYQTLIWMFGGKVRNNLIMKTHYRCLRSIHNTQKDTYQDIRDFVYTLLFNLVSVFLKIFMD